MLELGGGGVVEGGEGIVCAESKANFLSPAQQLEPRLVLPLPT